ncbi:energy-coupling factor ABC transporter substrate-binding protein [Streptomyces sp. ISL-10]|uniref:energy-coupling factor ABC transporter substrate-binding protein n=1 Tax=Streptomyces sp. ISL-10 TaxID=2819172 RepID=UPI001BEBEB71|nr:energy-coupling factor ABC transporter substrate-binding protein [Streptomyces sp. ISL-10]MBT2366107.1 energy-coupling factor ABC transporter substrate-binding protein [Streptomyces sp. ISL-10]
MSRNARINTLLLLAVAALAVLPLVLGLGDHKEEPFTGADAQAETAITELEPDYEPWFSPLYEPPSGEIESALFALQAAIGAGVLAYYFGLRRGRRQGEERAAARAGEVTGGVVDEVTGEVAGAVDDEVTGKVIETTSGGARAGLSGADGRDAAATKLP